MNISFHLRESPPVEILDFLRSVNTTVSFNSFNANADVFVVEDFHTAATAHSTNPVAKILYLSHGERLFQVPRYITVFSNWYAFKQLLFFI